jgi:hypothetical protein
LAISTLRPGNLVTQATLSGCCFWNPLVSYRRVSPPSSSISPPPSSPAQAPLLSPPSVRGNNPLPQCPFYVANDAPGGLFRATSSKPGLGQGPASIAFDGRLRDLLDPSVGWERLWVALWGNPPSPRSLHHAAALPMAGASQTLRIFWPRNQNPGDGSHTPLVQYNCPGHHIDFSSGAGPDWVARGNARPWS